MCTGSGSSRVYISLSVIHNVPHISVVWFHAQSYILSPHTCEALFYACYFVVALVCAAYVTAFIEITKKNIYIPITFGNFYFNLVVLFRLHAHKYNWVKPVGKLIYLGCSSMSYSWRWLVYYPYIYERRLIFCWVTLLSIIFNHF